MTVVKLKDIMYDSAQAGCDYVKTNIDKTAQVIDMSFDDKKECGFFVVERRDRKDVYQWNKVVDGSMGAYRYVIIKEVNDELPVGIIEKITNKFKNFEY